MPWVAVGTAAVGAIGSIMGSRSAAAAQDRAIDSQERLANRELDFNQQRYDRYLDIYDKPERAMVEEAFGDGHTAAYGREKGGLEAGFKQASDKIDENAQYMPGGLTASLVSGLGIERAKGLASLERVDAERKDARKMQLISGGSGQGEGAARGLNSALSDSQGFYSGLARNYGSLAASGMQAFGQNMKDLGSSFATAYKG